jgi:hypothetical protein
VEEPGEFLITHLYAIFFLSEFVEGSVDAAA